MAHKIKKSLGETLFDFFNICFLIFAAFITLYPMWHELNLSLSSAVEAMRGGFFFYPREFSLRAYKFLLSQDFIWIAYKNSTYVTVIATALAVIFQAAVAYPLTKKDMPGQKFLLGLLLFSMMFGGGMIPAYLLIKNLGLINTLWALILPGVVGGYNVIIMKNFFQRLPIELEESAFMDGANPIRIFFQIILPLSTPVLATVALWEAVGHWNSFFNALLYITDRKKYTLPLLVRDVVMGQKQQTNVEGGVQEFALESSIAATIMLATGPILILYPFLQKYFVKGIMLGSVKG